MEASPWDVLVVSSNLENRQDVAGMLFRLGLDPICVSTIEQCKALPERGKVGLVFCDRDLKDGDYRDVVAAVESNEGTSPMVVMMAELESHEAYQRARRDGLFDVISYPCRPTDVEWMVILARRNSRSQSKGFSAPARNLAQLWRAAGAGA
jgi:DNA-binding NtrC family response regulator